MGSNGFVPADTQMIGAFFAYSECIAGKFVRGFLGRGVVAMKRPGGRSLRVFVVSVC